MGIYCISPSNQGGELHKPPPKLVEACKPLHPLEFGLLYLLTHKGIGDGGSVSVGPKDATHFDKQIRAVKLLEAGVAKKLLPPIVKRLRAMVRKELGKEYCDGLADRVGPYTQGADRKDGAAAGAVAIPGNMNLSLLLLTHGLHRTFGMTSYMNRMAANLAWPGDWAPAARCRCCAAPATTPPSAPRSTSPRSSCSPRSRTTAARPRGWRRTSCLCTCTR